MATSIIHNAESFLLNIYGTASTIHLPQQAGRDEPGDLRSDSSFSSSLSASKESASLSNIVSAVSRLLPRLISPLNDLCVNTVD